MTHDAVHRLFERGRPPGHWRLHVWSAPDGPRIDCRDDLVLEFAGRIGHPSSYGLLGGHGVPGQTTYELRVAGRPFVESMAARGDDVEFGLPSEYRRAISGSVATGLVVTVAAHGRVSSSQLVFRWLALTLRDWLRHGVPEQPEPAWERFDSLLSRA